MIPQRIAPYQWIAIMGHRQAYDPSSGWTPPSGDHILLESGDDILLESGDYLLKE